MCERVRQKLGHTMEYVDSGCGSPQQYEFKGFLFLLQNILKWTSENEHKIMYFHF